MTAQPQHIEALNGVSNEDRRRIAEHIAKTVKNEYEMLDLMGADQDSSNFALDADRMDNANAVSAVSRDLHGLERPQGSDPGTSAGSFNYRP